MEELTIKELLAMCDKKCPSIEDMKAIKIKVEAIQVEMQDHMQTIQYFEKLMEKKNQISN